MFLHVSLGKTPYHVFLLDFDLDLSTTRTLGWGSVLCSIEMSLYFGKDVTPIDGCLESLDRLRIDLFEIEGVISGDPSSPYV